MDTCDRCGKEAELFYNEEDELSLCEECDMKVGYKPEVVQVIWECWIAGNKDSFVKLDSLTEVQDWVSRMLPGLRTHGILKVVPHLSNEYE